MADKESSVRYERLLQVIAKALKQSRSQFDINKAIQECYGEDANIFQGDNGSVLQALLESVLDKTNETVQEDMLVAMRENMVESKLLRLEKIIKQLEAQANQKQQAEENDKATAKQALDEAKLPDGLQPSDIITYRAYQKMLEEKEAMMREIEQVERQVEQLEADKELRSSKVHSQLKVVDQAGKELEKSADVCSTIS